MPKTFKPADEDVYEILRRVLNKHFSVLTELRPALTFDIQFVEDFDNEGNLKLALKKNRHPCAGMIKRVPADERAKGGSDVRIWLDAMLWNSYSDLEREAVLFHECMHIEPRRGKYGVVKEDAYGRVDIGFRPDDWMMTGFKATIEVYGASAIEHQSLHRVIASLEQKTLPFGDSADPDLPTTVSFGSAAFPAIANASAELKRRSANA